MLSLFILVPLIALVLLNLLPRVASEKIIFGVVMVLALLQAALVAFHPAVFWSAPIDPVSAYLAIKLSVDSLSMILLLSIGIVVCTSLFVAQGMLTDERQRFNFMNLLLLALIGMNATIMITDLFTLYVFIEVTAVSTFILIAIQKGALALEGAFKYMVLSAIATVLMLTSIALIVLISGGTSFETVSIALKVASASFYAKLAVVLFLSGLFIKSGIVPFHGWLPDAYSAAPSSTSVLLAGIVTKATGVYVLMRLVISVFGYSLALQNLLMFVGALSIIVGALAALGQTDLKRMLSYSSISQVGYIILALGCGSKLAIAGAAFHIFNHAIFKSLLFVNASAVEKQIGTVNMENMNGLASKMPITSSTSMIAFLSTAGIPPLSGFWSKFIIVIALWASGNHAYATIALLASLLTLAYFLLMQRKVFFCKLQSEVQNVKEAGFWLAVPQIVLALIIIFVGVGFPFVLDRFILTVENILR